MKSLGSLIKEYRHNKLIDLEVAKKCNLDIPKTWVISNIRELRLILKGSPGERYITKSMNNPISFPEQKKMYIGGVTCRINNDLQKNNFTPSLLQEEISKLFEVRVFFILDKYYSMAIFSQQDDSTALDYRNYNIKKPNRMIPFHLPIPVEEKLKEFAKISKINTGSFDLIVDENYKFIFLEINRAGQFDWLSGICNYYIEKEIAKTLVKI